MHQCPASALGLQLPQPGLLRAGVAVVGPGDAQHDGLQAVEHDALHVHLHLLQAALQLPLLPAQTALQLLRPPVLLLQLLERERERERESHDRRPDGRPDGRPDAPLLRYLDVELSPPQQVEGGVPGGVRGQGDLLLQLLQAAPQLSSPAAHKHNRGLSRMLLFLQLYQLLCFNSLWTDLQSQKERARLAGLCSHTLGARCTGCAVHREHSLVAPGGGLPALLAAPLVGRLRAERQQRRVPVLGLCGDNGLSEEEEEEEEEERCSIKHHY
ncbi:hypothetical protein EYF80_049887 [Liparis tanakae]|uniref:Uncharacterized protein n=1 Tax=Liparis tanakae TaxID=230148 RepID=A0A4Z2FG78_9TELE|nr:hypothetical protein EYF80_049887 [Liparis tanakae]